MKEQPPRPEPLWDTLSVEAQAAVSSLVRCLEQRIADLEERLGKNSTNSSKPPLLRSPLGQAATPAPPRARSGAGNPAIIARSAHSYRPSNSARSSTASRPSAAGAAPPSPVTTPSRSGTRSPRCRRSNRRWTSTGSIASSAPDVAPRPVRPCRLAYPEGRSAPGFGPSSASWSGATAWASDRPANWSSTCRPDDLRRHDRPAGAAGRRGVGGSRRGATPVRPHCRRGPTSTRPRGGRAGRRGGSGRR